MKYYFLITLYFSLVRLSAQPKDSQYQNIFNGSYAKGEELAYNVTFGFITVGNATTRIDKKSYYVGNRKCLKVEGAGATAKWISWISRVDDLWGAYLDSSAVLPHVSYRHIREGGYKKDEWVAFNHQQDSAYVREMKEDGNFTNYKKYKIPNNTKDLVSGFMYLRVLNFNLIKKGDTISMPGFLEDTSYTLKIIYAGKEIIKTKLGKISCYKLVPIVPDNKIFSGKNAISCWISSDGNQIPVRIQAKMFIGNAGLELAEYKGLVNPFRLEE